MRKNVASEYFGVGESRVRSPTIIYRNAPDEFGKKILLNVGQIQFSDFFCTPNTLRPNASHSSFAVVE